MKNFSRGGSGDFGRGRSGDRRPDRDSGGRGFSSGKSWGKRGDSETQMHKTTCTECGRGCEVPFRPTGEKPVYCSACFENKGGKRANFDTSRDDRFAKRDFNDRGRPPVRENSSSSIVPNDGGVKKQLELINTKLERLIKVVEDVVGSGQMLKGESVDEKKKASVFKLSKKDNNNKEEIEKKINTPVKSATKKGSVAKAKKGKSA